ncbi:MAG: amino acid adenylation domain-containing protein [Micromonosporaceae bacterium]
MSHLQVLREIESRGLSISAAGDDLRLQGPRDRMDPELIGRIKAYKTELVSHLSTPEAPAEPEGIGLTPLQRSYLLGRGDLFEFGNVANHIYREIEGSWDLDRLEAALRSVVARHGALRCRFTADGRQVQEESVDVRIPRLDLRGAGEDEQRRMRRVLREERSRRILPADTAPLFAIEATIFADEEMVLHFSQDGLVMDAVSAMLFMREWWRAYQGEPDTEEQAPFDAYLAKLEAARAKPPYQRSRDYWLARLDDLAPCPDLPLRTSPSAITHPRFTPRTISLDPRRWSELKARAAQAGLTPSSVLFAGYAETLAAWGAGSRFTLNTTVAQRPPMHPRILDAIGPFSDTMLVEIDLDPALSFQERALALQAQLRRDIDNRHFSGIEAIRELGRRRTDAAQVRMPYTFNSAIGYPQRDLDGSTFELFGPEVYSVSQTPQVWVNVFAREQHGGLLVQVDGVDELFPEGLLDAVVTGYRTLLERLLDSVAWSATSFDLLPDSQRAARRAANDTTRPVPATLPQDAFVRHATDTPDAPAVITTGGTLSYHELHRRAGHAAQWLTGHGVGRGDLVGLVMTRGPEQVVGILATVLAGAAYLPVDATLPVARQRYLLTDGQVRCVLTNTDLGYDGDWRVYQVDAAAPLNSAPEAASEAAPEAAPAPGADPDDLAYVLYTSGTTGEPKGVMVSHRSVANVVADCNARFGIGPGDRFFGISAFTFDLSAYDVFGALSAGAAIVLPDADRAADASHWLRCCQRYGVTVWNSVPSIVSLLHEQASAESAGAEGAGAESAGALDALRLVMMSGDRIPPALPAALRRLKPGLDVVSLGGPTETTIWNIVHPIGPDSDGSRSIPYGRPNANNRLYLLDRHGRDVPDWVPGEICAAGAGLARGYWRDEQRTAERFYHDAERGERLYRTGDLGRYRPDGTIEILGRSDHQLKVNGYRVEAGEVETRLTAIDGVRQAVVTREEASNGARLLAHLVAAGDVPPSDDALRQELASQLPDYMIPAAVVWHEALPLTRNGKLDRAALARTAPAAPAAPARPADGPPTPTEREVAQLWASVLGLERVGVADRFRDLGGDSIGAARIVTKVRKRFGVAIPMHRLPEVETVRAMAGFIEAAAGEGGR